jgi:hypothetical protein
LYVHFYPYAYRYDPANHRFKRSRRMDGKIIVRGLDLDGNGFAVAIHRDGTDQPAYISDALDAGDCARVLIYLAARLKATGCSYQVQVCERLADIAHSAVAVLN